MRKIIKASAGTGKTYSLSLEFINILLSYPQVSFEEIVVITFTKKATAEIRERIFQHLESIIKDDSEKNPVVQNLKKLNPSISLKSVKEKYRYMVANKDKLRITTIDSFVNSIFRNIVAPNLNIGSYEIDPEINEKYLPLIFKFILTSENMKKFEIIFKNFKAKSMEKFKKFIKKIIDERWMFDFAKTETFIEENQNEYYKLFGLAISEAFKFYKDYLENEGIDKVSPKNKKLNKDFWEFMEDYAPIDTDDLVDKVLNRFDTLISQDRLTLFKVEKFIPSIRKKDYSDLNEEIKELLSLAKTLLANCLFLTDFASEHFAIVNLAEEILKYYDSIKFNTKIFTYSDISYYTFKYLYSENTSADSDFSVLNLFYEKLAYKTRFMLIDEFQDTSIIQWNIINPIIAEIISGAGQKEYGGTIIVGDEKQAIYGWRGGERELLIKSDRFIPFAEYKTLNTSYRSRKVIVNFINELFGGMNSDWQYGDMKSIKEGGFVKVQFKNLYKSDESKQDYYEKILMENFFPHINEMDLSETAIIARTNSELEEIALILKHHNINYLLESSSFLPDYPLVKSILFLLRFLAKFDYKSLVAFLRSDVILAKPTYLQNIFQCFQTDDAITPTQFFELNKNDEIINKIKTIYYEVPNLKLSQIIGRILEEFAYYKIFTNEVDLVNLDYFLSIVNDFEENNTENAKEVVSFLNFLQDNKTKFRQMQTQDSDVVKLLTIHKSKGLGFKNVFAFFKLLKKGNLSFHDLESYYRFTDDYTEFTEFYVTLNFKTYIKETSLTDIYTENEKRKFYEEINAFYVALTRAKNNLFIFLEYSQKDGLEKIFSQTENKPAVSLFKNFFYRNKFIEDEMTNIYTNGKLTFSKQNKNDRKTEFPIDLQNKLAFKKEPITLQKTNEDHFVKFVLEPKAIYGTVAHYYLSNIGLNYETEKFTAQKRAIAKYASILPLEKVLKIIKKTDEFIEKNFRYFDANLWDKVLCEYSIFDKNGKEYRVDRLLMKDKKILIIDFKTGEKYKKEQLEIYKSIVQKVMPRYLVSTLYLEITL